jgi:hypothetical protein
MPQVTRTVNDCIVNSLYLLGELGTNEPADSFMLSTGLELFNELLDKFSSDSIYIPFLSTISSTFVIGQATYSISDIILGTDITADRVVDLSMATYTVPTTGSTNLIYPMRIINKAQYYGVVRQNNLLARPGFIFLDKQATESFITVYPAPDQAYPFSLLVKSMINELKSQDTMLELPPNYYGFMKYALARKFRAYYPSGNWPETNEEEYEDYYMTIKNSNETDLTIRPSVTLTAPEPFYWPNILSY